MMNDPYLYFLYSEQQKIKRIEIEAKMSRKFIPGYVIINGQKQFFTELSTKPTNIYPDVRLIAEGLKSTMKFSDIRIESARK